LRIFLKNPLHIPIAVKNIKVICKDGLKYRQNSPSVLLDPFKKREVLLQIIPLEVGDFEIQSLEWELFEVVLCKRKINLTVRKGKNDNTLRFKAIEPSGECSA